MAEMIFKDLVYKNSKKYMFNCVSRATSMEEIGNDIYPKAKSVLLKNNVTLEKHSATQVVKSDYDKYDYIICMEERNKRDLLRIFGSDFDNKIHLLLDFTEVGGDIDDPWYTDRFDECFDLINKGCVGLFNYLLDLGDKNGDEV
jgi:protein-tyrosine phosphatase